MATMKSKVARKAKRKPVGATKPRIPVKKTRLRKRHAVAKRKVPGTQAASRTAKPQIVVVNMIPNSLSGESHQDSEPTLTVNPVNPLQIAASAFTPDPAGGDIAPIYVSVDGGMSWSLNSIVPSSAADGSATADITVAFGSSSNRLYAGIIRLPYPADRTRLNILRTDDFRGGTVMKVLVDRTGKGVDQPYVQAMTVPSGPDKGKDRLYVGDNDFSSPGSTATIDQSLDAGRPNPSFTSVRIEKRATSGQDGPSIRPAIHQDGTVYAVFHSWRTFSNSTGHGTADVVVVRDDNGGAGAHPFTALLDPGDGKAGVRVAQGVKFNFDGFLGLQRTGGDVNIAVDPTNSANVYVAYNADEGSDYVLHLCQSADRGATWSVDVRTLRNALNPSLAVNNAGTLGLLYQQLTGTGAAQRWMTKFESTKNGSTWTAATLANVPANEPVKQFDPYLGDYQHLTAVGKNFYGIFCANNAPKKANFPQGVKYQRNANFATGTLLDVDNTTPVHISIDPFFFKVTT